MIPCYRGPMIGPNKNKGASFVAEGRSFDGVNSHMLSNASWYGSASLYALCSIWFRYRADTTAEETLIANGTSGTSRFAVSRKVDNTIRVRGRDTGGTIAVEFSTTTALPDIDNAWHNLVFKLYLDVVGRADCWIDRQRSISTVTGNGNAVDFAQGLASVGALGDSSARSALLSGDLSEIWFKVGQNITSVPIDDTPLIFSTAEGKARPLGVNGELAIPGVVPETYIHWPSGPNPYNRGSRGTFAMVNGTISPASAHPPT